MSLTRIYTKNDNFLNLNPVSSRFREDYKLYHHSSQLQFFPPIYQSRPALPIQPSTPMTD